MGRSGACSSLPGRERIGLSGCTSGGTPPTATWTRPFGAADPGECGSARIRADPFVWLSIRHNRISVRHRFLTHPPQPCPLCGASSCLLPMIGSDTLRMGSPNFEGDSASGAAVNSVRTLGAVRGGFERNGKANSLVRRTWSPRPISSRLSWHPSEKSRTSRPRRWRSMLQLGSTRRLCVSESRLSAPRACGGASRVARQSTFPRSSRTRR